MTFLNISQPRVNIEVVKLVITLLTLNSFFLVKFFQIVVQKFFIVLWIYHKDSSMTSFMWTYPHVSIAAMSKF